MMVFRDHSSALCARFTPWRFIHKDLPRSNILKKYMLLAATLIVVSEGCKKDVHDYCCGGTHLRSNYHVTPDVLKVFQNATNVQGKNKYVVKKTNNEIITVFPTKEEQSNNPNWEKDLKELNKNLGINDVSGLSKSLKVIKRVNNLWGWMWTIASGATFGICSGVWAYLEMKLAALNDKFLRMTDDKNKYYNSKKIIKTLTQNEIDEIDVWSGTSASDLLILKQGRTAEIERLEVIMQNATSDTSKNTNKMASKENDIEALDLDMTDATNEMASKGKAIEELDLDIQSLGDDLNKINEDNKKDLQALVQSITGRGYLAPETTFQKYEIMSGTESQDFLITVATEFWNEAKQEVFEDLSGEELSKEHLQDLVDEHLNTNVANAVLNTFYEKCENWVPSEHRFFRLAMQEITILKAQKKTLQDEIKDLEENINSLETEKVSLNEDLTELTEEQSRMDTNMKGDMEKHETLTKEIETLTKGIELKGIETDIETTEKAIKNLKLHIDNVWAPLLWVSIIAFMMFVTGVGCLWYMFWVETKKTWCC